MRPVSITLKSAATYNPDLFAGLQVPAEIDKQKLINLIYLKSNNLTVLYTDFNYFAWAIGAWSAARIDVWKRLEATRHYDYIPIHNYDRHETGTDVRDGDYTEKGTYEDSYKRDSTGNTTSNGNRKTDGTEETTGERTASGTLNSEQNNTRAGFNNREATVPKETIKLEQTTTEKENTSGNSTTGETETITNTSDVTGNESGSADGSNTGSRTEDWTDTHNFYAYGNIGVTSTQELINQQRQVEMFNLYDIISDEFVEQFCLMVY